MGLHLVFGQRPLLSPIATPSLVPLGARPSGAIAVDSPGACLCLLSSPSSAVYVYIVRTPGEHATHVEGRETSDLGQDHVRRYVDSSTPVWS